MTSAFLDLSRSGKHIVVRRNDGHPESYLWIDVGERTFFLGVLEPGMRRGDVRTMAERWIAKHT